MRSLLAIAVILFIGGLAPADEAPAPEREGQAEFRAGWRALLAPSGGQGTEGTRQERQEALLAALPHFEAAVAAAPGDLDCRTALVYANLEAAKYQQAYDIVSEAIARNRDDPLLYLLRAQAEAALAHMDPETTSDKIEKALRSFDDAAHLDPTNSLYALQAASVAFDAKRPDLGLAKVEQALQLPGMMLHRLPIPGDLDPDPTTSIRMWQRAQMSQWSELLARCQNAARMISKLGREKAESGDLDGAEALFRQALEIGRHMGNAKPNLFISVNAALNVMEDAYLNLARVAHAKQDPEEQRWAGEAGVLGIGRQELFVGLQHYLKLIEEAPPASLDDLLREEAEYVARTMLGVGLSPTAKPKPQGKSKQRQQKEEAPTSE